jgi:cytochrome c2
MPESTVTSQVESSGVWDLTFALKKCGLRGTNVKSTPLGERMKATRATSWALVFGLLVIGVARAEGDAARGEAHFKECAACHKLAAGTNEVGPSLHGLISRKAGELADFRYSPAMKRSGITWTAESLDKYLADPQAFIPGNRMPYAGMSNAADRADLIAYLQKATQ